MIISPATKYVLAASALILIFAALFVRFSDTISAQNIRLNLAKNSSFTTLKNNPLLPGLDADFANLSQENARVDINDLLSGGPPKDGIPSIDNPIFELISQTAFNADELIIGVEINGEAKAYPYAILNWHEVVNDTVGDEAVAVTYCPLCETNAVFSRNLNNEIVEFGVSGKLYNSCLVLHDRTTNSLYAQPWGLGIGGSEVNTVLERLPGTRTTIGEWQKVHPDSLILTTETGYNRDYSRYPYGSYYTDNQVIFPVRNQDKWTAAPKDIVQIVLEHDSSVTPLSEFAGESVALFQKDVQRDGEVMFDWNGDKAVAKWNEKLNTIEFFDASGDRLPDMALFHFVDRAFF